MDATKRQAAATVVADDDDTDETPHGCAHCGKHIPIAERRRLRMVEHDVEPELCLACQSDRLVKRQLGGVYVLRHEAPYNRAQRRQIAQERAQAERAEETKRRRLERLLTQG